MICIYINLYSTSFVCKPFNLTPNIQTKEGLDMNPLFHWIVETYTAYQFQPSQLNMVGNKPLHYREPVKWNN